MYLTKVVLGYRFPARRQENCDLAEFPKQYVQARALRGIARSHRGTCDFVSVLRHTISQAIDLTNSNEEEVQRKYRDRSHESYVFLLEQQENEREEDTSGTCPKT